MLFVNKILLYFLCLNLVSCAGYQVIGDQNPFEEYDIASISIPVFLNRSIIAGVSGPISTEIKKVFKEYTPLEIFAGNNTSADSVLVGIIDSKKGKSAVYKKVGSTFTDGDLQDSIGGRNQFYIPSATQYTISVKLILIKNPNLEELQLLKTPLAQAMNSNPKIIFQKDIVVTGSFSRVIRPTISPDSAGTVNFTANRQVFRKSLAKLSKDIGNIVKEEIIYAY